MRTLVGMGNAALMAVVSVGQESTEKKNTKTNCFSDLSQGWTIIMFFTLVNMNTQEAFSEDALVSASATMSSQRCRARVLALQSQS